MSLGALILTGGGSTRMGADKARLIWNGLPASERCVRLALGLGADPALTVGGGGDIADDRPGAGPVGGILAGARRLREAGCARMLVLAVDAPTARAEDLAPLLCAEGPGAAYAGLHLPLVVALSDLPAEAEDGWPVARLIERSGLARPPCAPDAATRLRGANTPDERAALAAALIAHEGVRQAGDD